MRGTEELAVRIVDTDSLLARFHRGGVLGLADVHTALGLGRIGDEPDELVLLAAGLAVRALRGGSVCVDLAAVADAVFEATDEQAVATAELPWPDPQEWLPRVAVSALVTTGASGGGTTPLRLLDTTLYLERYWSEEETVRRQLQSRRHDDGSARVVDVDRLRAGLDRVFSPDRLAADEPDRQRIAAAVAVLGRITVLAGGPGTGKTTTVAKVLALLADQPGGHGPQGARVALAAPTGKAAARLAEAVADATAELPPEDAARVGRWPAYTLHRLLGTIPDRPGRFRHNAENHLPYEVIVVDEMSMVSLPLMARLLEAVRPDARLVLVGDPDQLTSVEAGAVMADIAAGATPLATPVATTELGSPAPYAPLADLGDDGRGLPLPPDVSAGVVRLTHTWRFGGAIGDLATAIREGEADRACEIVTAGHPDVEFLELTEDLPRPDRLTPIRDRVQAAARNTAAAAGDGRAHDALQALDAHRLLCAHRAGPYGVSRWTHEVERWLASAELPHGRTGSDSWYPGRPVLITSNDYELGLFNGDTGVVINTDDGLRAVFARGERWVSYAPARLEQAQTVHAMTVHRSQGSQFTEVSFVLPPADSPLLTRELLYTAVTRATTTVSIVGSLAAIHRAVQRPANRASGLRHRLS